MSNVSILISHAKHIKSTSHQYSFCGLQTPTGWCQKSEAFFIFQVDLGLRSNKPCKQLRYLPQPLKFLKLSPKMDPSPIQFENMTVIVVQCCFMSTHYSPVSFLNPYLFVIPGEKQNLPSFYCLNVIQKSWLSLQNFYALLLRK